MTASSGATLSGWIRAPPKALTGYQLFTLGVRTEGFQMAEPADIEGRHMGKEKPV